MPSNQVRGFIVGGFNELWTKSPTVRSAATLLCALNAIAFAVNLSALAEPVPPPPPRPDPFFCDAGASRFAAERNLYLNGFSLFIYFIMRRMLEIQTQLFAARKAAKGE